MSEREHKTTVRVEDGYIRIDLPPGIDYLSLSGEEAVNLATALLSLTRTGQVRMGRES